MKRFFYSLIGLCTLLFMISLTSCKETQYNKAISMIENKEYASAYEIFEKLEDYEDSENYFSNFYYVPLKITYKYGETTANEYTDFLYNDDGLLVQIITTSSDNSSGITNFSYDANGNISQRVIIYPNGDNSTYEYYYDSDNNNIKTIYTNYEGEKTFYDYSYDTNGNRIKQITTKSENEKIYYDYIYDINGNRIKTVYTDYHENKSIYDYLYIDNLLVKTIYTDNDDSQSIDEYIYDANGNLLSQTSINFDGEKAINNYSYDEQGNLIQDIYIITMEKTTFVNIHMMSLEIFSPKTIHIAQVKPVQLK